MTGWLVRDEERGVVSVELAILAPALLAALVLIIAFGRSAAASSHVDGAAYGAARSASIQRDPGAARAAAQSSARDYLAQRGVACEPEDIDVDTSGFGAGLGEQGSVEVSVGCTVPMQDLTLVLPVGDTRFEGSAVSPVDAYRGQQ